MYFQFACPSCQKNLKVREEHAGSRVRCPYCHTAMTVKAPARESSEGFGDLGQEQSSKGDGGDFGGWSASGTDVNMLHSALYGLGSTVVFYALVFPFRDFYFGELFLERGWVPYVLTFLTSWSAAVLFIKSRMLARQKDSMFFDLLPVEISENITARNVGKFTDHIRSLPTNPNESFLVNRVLRGLEHFRVLQSNPEVAGRLASQSEIDATAVESSYTGLKVFIWAIPILGFIGTVMGISQAVQQFSGELGGVAEMSAIKDSLNDVVDGLAVAFDTTLIALVMSLLVMFPTSSVQKSEEDLLNWVDEYCNENLLKRLKDVDRGLGAGASAVDHTKAIQKSVDAAMADHHAELKTWSKKLESIGGTLTDQVVDGWTKVGDQMQKQYLEQGMAGTVDRLQQTLSELAHKNEAVQTQIADSIQEANNLLRESFGALKDGVESLNGALDGLNQKQIVIATSDENRRKGVFDFFRRKSNPA